MPAIFAYSLCISLLAGNGNIVRISPRLAPAAAPVCDVIHRIWQDDKFAALRRQNAIVTYGRDDELTSRFSRQCDGRIVWGGDKSIAEIRTFPLPPQGVELVFADRYSFAVFDCSCIQNGTDDELRAWAHRFYNDTYEADQNACSSPRFVFWLDERESSFEAAQRRWWDAVAAEAKAYDLPPIKTSGKYTDAWEFAMTQPHLQSRPSGPTGCTYTPVVPAAGHYGLIWGLRPILPIPDPDPRRSPALCRQEGSDRLHPGHRSGSAEAGPRRSRRYGRRPHRTCRTGLGYERPVGRVQHARSPVPRHRVRRLSYVFL